MANIEKIIQESLEDNIIDDSLYKKYEVKKGLRNEDGTGVVVTLTKISDVYGYWREENNEKIEDKGNLIYRGYSIFDLYRKVEKLQIDGYEYISFLLLFGWVPNESEMEVFNTYLRERYDLPETFLSETILKTPSMDIMNKIQRSILHLYSLDDTPDDASPTATVLKGLSLLAKLPAIIVYSHFSQVHHYDNEDLIIRPISHEIGLAESFLTLLKGEKATEEEIKLLDLLMIIHADHGAANNSTFTNLVVSSTGTDIYSTFAASVGSLKGPKHGGANILAKDMMDAVIDEIGVDADEDDIHNIVERIYNKDFYDQKGLIYGIGHAIYTKSDPRCVLLKKKATELAQEKGEMQVFDFYNRFENVASEFLSKKLGKSRCANVDFYSGFIYDMMGIPDTLYTPIFALSRMIGWLSHNVEEKLNSGKIIRPAGRYVGGKKDA